MGYLTTRNRKDFFEVASLLQKSLRRGEMTLAARAANELFPKYANYIWKRLMTVSAEDCADIVTTEIVALFDAWTHINKGATPANSKGRVFIAKAIILLAKAKHDRSADELNILVSDRFPEEEFDKALAEVEPLIGDSDDIGPDIPAWVYDVHTKRGKAMGKTKAQFLREESDGLVNKSTVWENLDEMIDSPTYVAPKPLF